MVKGRCFVGGGKGWGFASGSNATMGGDGMVVRGEGRGRDSFCKEGNRGVSGLGEGETESVKVRELLQGGEDTNGWGFQRRTVATARETKRNKGSEIQEEERGSQSER